MQNSTHSVPVKPGETIIVRVAFRTPYRRVDYALFGRTACQLLTFGKPDTPAGFKAERDAKALILSEGATLETPGFRITGRELLISFTNPTAETVWTPNVIVCADDDDGCAEG